MTGTSPATEDGELTAIRWEIADRVATVWLHRPHPISNPGPPPGRAPCVVPTRRPFCCCLTVLDYRGPQDEGADLVVALTHMRTPNDRHLAAEVPELSLILGGHDHTWEAEVTRPHGTVIVKSGAPRPPR